MKRLGVIGLIVSAVACGNSTPPAAPTPPPPAQIAGNWSGTFESQTYTAEAIVVTLNQTGTSVSGTWAMTSGVQARGNVSGTVDTTSFSGTVTYNYTNGPTCSGAFSGTAATSSLTWSSPGFTTGSCGLSSPGNPLGVRFVLQRR